VDDDTDKLETPPETSQEGGKSKGSGFLIKAGIVAAVLLVEIAGSYFLQKTMLFPNPGVAEAKAEVKKEKEQEAKKKAAEEELSVVMLDEIVVNPADTGGRRYLVVTLGLQTSAPEAEKTVEKYKPLIRDALISLLSSKHLDELSRISYRDSLRSELTEAVNKQVHGLTIDNVVFSSYVLQ
jgi:flagellar FliL protein